MAEGNGNTQTFSILFLLKHYVCGVFLTEFKIEGVIKYLIDSMNYRGT